MPNFSLSSKKLGKTKVAQPGKQNIFWHRSEVAPPPKNFTPGIIPVLKQALLKSHAKGQTIRAALCYEGMVHVATEWWDMGWGCGYRNFLMACTALIDQQVQPLYFPALDQPTPPGVANLQHWIEDAWDAGFDEEGAADLKHKLVGTKKWIGTAELYVALLARGIPSQLVDFPRVASSADAVLTWVERYFTSPSSEAQAVSVRAKVKTSVDDALRGASPVVLTDRMPLVLQHEGHSRTIVGFERLKNGSINLLCFDPSKRPNDQVRKAALAYFESARSHPSLPASSTSLRKQHGISPSKIINHVLHPLHYKDNKEHRSQAHASTSPGKKRRSDEASDTENMRDIKRVRGGLYAPQGQAGGSSGVIVIQSDDSEDEIQMHEARSPSKSNGDSNSRSRNTAQDASELVTVDYAKALDFFRLKPRKVGRNDKYQILYFPLEGVLSEQERWARRVVTSEVVH
ncbi:peptidase family C78-domain-containing protein [Phellopilus nigrolimitatus]|nr:peptidase family C78-domain-containing protein [Phellopilus nigrolimitatus]